MVGLIILDMYGTIVPDEPTVSPRNGFAEFMERYGDSKFALATDDDRMDIVRKHLEELGIAGRMEHVYVFQDMVEIEGYGGARKDLKRICSDLGVQPSKAVFIGDGDSDVEDARRDGVNFVHVPRYEKRSEPFSFGMIDLSHLRAYLDLRSANHEGKEAGLGNAH